MGYRYAAEGNGHGGMAHQTKSITSQTLWFYYDQVYIFTFGLF
jgi:hypothetical protein